MPNVPTSSRLGLSEPQRVLRDLVLLVAERYRENPLTVLYRGAGRHAKPADIAAVHREITAEPITVAEVADRLRGRGPRLRFVVGGER